MVKILSRLNLVIGLLMLVSTFTALNQARNEIKNFGWNYERTVSVGMYIYTETVSVLASIISIVMVGLMGVLFLANSTRVGSGLTLKISPDTVTGITFPLGDPDDWDINMELATKHVTVKLDTKEVRFPLEMLNEWSTEYDKTKEVDTP